MNNEPGFCQPDLAAARGSPSRVWCLAHSAHGMAYNPVKNHWRLLPAMPLPRHWFAAVWTGHRVLVWGGLNSHRVPPAHGEAYNPATNRWSALPPAPLRGRAWPLAAWGGHQMIIWGGFLPGTKTTRYFTDGAAYRP